MSSFYFRYSGVCVCVSPLSLFFLQSCLDFSFICILIIKAACQFPQQICLNFDWDSIKFIHKCGRKAIFSIFSVVGWIVFPPKLCWSPNPNTYEHDLIWKWIFADVINLKWGQTWSGWALNSMTGILIMIS